VEKGVEPFGVLKPWSSLLRYDASTSGKGSRALRGVETPLDSAIHIETRAL